ncbi:hypothetical protein CROQUDRAFT_687340, partial [Cronartium quercuum f. sp. fusiforme G11]
IVQVAELKKWGIVCLPHIKQLLFQKLHFPLPHWVVKFQSTFIIFQSLAFYYTLALNQNVGL